MKPANYGVISFLLYGLGFLLLWEWLRPLSEITNTGRLSIFVLFTAFAFLLSYLRLPYWVVVPAKGMAFLYALHSLFFFRSIFNPHWLGYLFSDIAHNIGVLFAADWQGMSNLFRSFLFLLLLWLISYLMHYWLARVRRVFVFFLATVLYVTVVDTFTAYDANAAIVRTVMVGFVLLGMLRFVQLQENERVSVPRHRFPISWIGALAGLLVVTATVGFAAPKVGPQWPDPVPFIKSSAQKYQNDSGNGGDGAVQRIGYGTDDSHLGGPFVDDDTPVFTAATEARRYWRVETKDVYTGKGWKNSKSGKWVAPKLDSRSAPNLYAPAVHKKKVHAQIDLADGRKFPQLVYGGEVAKVDQPNGVHLQINNQTDKIQMINNSDPVTADQYGLTFKEPEFSIEELKKSKENTEGVKEKYLQLPKSVPDRVQQLAKKITKNDDNRYDKSKSVEQFFKDQRFSYNTKEVAVPDENEDYVAQFLFDTQKGYCDNFSTSMAVMLRAIEIPTRWVKGFTPGNYQKTKEDGTDVYQITNANAHSWVEVYFPEAGWVPFEPTKGFSGRSDFVSSYDDESETSTDASTDEETTPEQQQDPEQTTSPEQQQMGQQEEAAGNGSSDAEASMFSWQMGTAAALLLFGIVVLIVFLTRRKWLPRLVRAQFKHRTDDEVLLRAYERLLKLLPMYGIKRKKHETLREYAISVDRALDTNAMKVLTSSYERARYHDEPSAQMWQDTKAQWQMIMTILSSK